MLISESVQDRDKGECHAWNIHCEQPASGVGGRNLRTAGFAAAVIFFIAARTGWGSVTGSISGVVHDSSGALIPAAEVVALNTQTGVKWTVATDAQGFYSFQALPVGDYEVDVSKSGFNGYRQTGLALTVNAALAVDVTLQVGLVSQQVTVTSAVVHVDTTSTQMGEVIGSNKITEVPLLTRGYTRSAGPATRSRTGQLRDGGGPGWRVHRHGIWHCSGLGRPQCRQPLGQRNAGIRERVPAEWRHGAGIGILRHGHHSEPRFDRGVSHSDQQL